MDLSELITIIDPEIEQLVAKVRTTDKPPVADIIRTIVVDIVPKAMDALRAVQGLDGQSKKQLVLDLVEHIITQLYVMLNHYLELDGVSWDEYLRDTLQIILPSMINRLVQVEQGKLKFTSPKGCKWLPCCTVK